MKEFNALRQRARERRDKAILRARNEYEQTLQQIAKLEQDLLGKEVSTHKSIAASIESVIPDRPFTTHDIMVGLEAADSTRVWRSRSIDSHITHLRKKGLVKRLRKARGHERALYVREGVEYEPIPFEDMSLIEVVAEVLGKQSMTQTELVVAMLEAGYHTTMKPKALRDTVGTAMRREPEKFVCKGGKWRYC